MAKKDDKILKHLNALKPNIPTTTRAKAKKSSIDEPNVIIKDSKPGFVELIFENLSAMEDIRKNLLKEVEKINLIMIDSWEKTMFISYDMQKTNFDYIMNIINKLISPFPK